MTFTTEQMKTLAPYEEHFRTAIRAKWARNPGRSALKVIWDTYTAATGDRRRFNDSCSTCILSLLHDCGELYYKDVEERAKKPVKASDKEMPVARKVTLKTRKK